ncbi:MAG: hypothetical protein WCT11_01000 [Candidatus Magasanikbacteria bacterium]|jgi:hypothetical protein
MRFKIWQAGFWGSVSTFLLLGLYKVVNAATLRIASLPGVSYMGPPNPRHLDGLISITIPSPAYGSDAGASLWSYIWPLLLGLVVLFIFIVGVVSIISFIVRKIRGCCQKKKGASKK